MIGNRESEFVPHFSHDGKGGGTPDAAREKEKTAILQAHNISFGYETGEQIFNNASISIHPGECVALVGRNGSGKSTLLKILAGLEKFQPRDGEVQRGNAEVLYLPQQIVPKKGDPTEHMTVHDWLFQKLGLADIHQDMQKLEQEMTSFSYSLTEAQKETVARHGDLQTRFQYLGGYKFEDNVKRYQSRVGLAVEGNQTLGTLSGGQGQRLKLLLLELAQHDYILMDEPTNDLDAEGKIILQERIERAKNDSKGVMMVSHDRVTLDRCANRIAAIDTKEKVIDKDNSSFSDFWAFRKQEKERLKHEHAVLQHDAAAQKRRLRKAQRGAGDQRRTTPSPDSDKLSRRAARERGQAKAATRVSQARKHLETTLEKIARISLEEEFEMKLDFEPTPIESKHAYSFEGIKVTLPDGRTFGPYSGDIKPGDHLALHGPNGSGKTTFLRMLMEEAAQEGEVRKAETAKVVYIPQDRLLNGEMVHKFVATQMEEHGVKKDEDDVRSRLAQCGIKAEHWNRPVDTLSPGEKTRLLTALINIIEPNMLVLDEPTNHLDLEAIESLEGALASYKGILVVVSHDEVFLKNIGINKNWEVSAEKILLR